MRFNLYLLIALFSFSCSLEKSMNNAEFDAVIAKLGDSPEKNSVEENIMVGDAYRMSNRLVEAIPFYEAAIKEGGAPEEANLYLAQGLKVEQKYAEAERILTNYLPKARDEKTKIFESVWF